MLTSTSSSRIGVRETLPRLTQSGGTGGSGLALRRRDVPATVFEAHDYPRHRSGRRLAAASLLHPYLLDPRRQRWPVLTSRMRLLPFRPLYHLTH